MENKARVISFYLPQFHPVEVNDKYWGKGFTEWTNVAKAKPLYKNHYQPQIPADLGFYDLRISEVREAQAQMAKECGVEGFCYWYYWFGRGKKVLEWPINEIMKLKKPDFPFCIGWGNHDWSNKTWQKTSSFKKDIVFLKQEYLGEKDYTDYFNDVLPMFKDERYIKVENKPLFYIYDPDAIPDIEDFIKLWNKLAIQNGLKGIFFVARADSIGKAHLINEKDFLNKSLERYDEYIKKGFNAVNSFSFRRAEILATGYFKKTYRAIKRKLTGYALNKHDYEKVMKNYYTDEDKLDYIFPTLMPRRDRTPRSGKNSLIYSNSTPEKFKEVTKKALDCVKDKNDERKVIFLDSWNEWGEGSYMEPDLVYGHGYLDVLKNELEGSSK